MKWSIIILFLVLPCKKFIYTRLVHDLSNCQFIVNQGFLQKNLKGVDELIQGHLSGGNFQKVNSKNYQHTIWLRCISKDAIMQHCNVYYSGTQVENYWEDNADERYYKLFLSAILLWHEKWYFKLSVATLSLLLTFLLFRAGSYAFLKKKQKYKAEVNQRIIALEESNRVKDQLTLLIAHDLQSPLHFLSILSDHVKKAATTNDINSVLEGADEIKSTALKIFSFIDEINLWNKTLSEQYELTATAFPVRDLIGELSAFFEVMLRLKNNMLEVVYINDPIVTTDRNVLKAILRNIIDNANKYTDNGTISIKVACNERNQLVLAIQDTGRGMNPTELEKLRHRLQHTATLPGIEKHDRLGFQFIAQFIAKLDATLTVDSTENEGTTLTITGISCRHQ